MLGHGDNDLTAICIGSRGPDSSKADVKDPEEKAGQAPPRLEACSRLGSCIEPHMGDPESGRTLEPTLAGETIRTRRFFGS